MCVCFIFTLYIFVALAEAVNAAKVQHDSSIEQHVFIIAHFFYGILIGTSSNNNSNNNNNNYKQQKQNKTGPSASLGGN